MHAAAAQIRDHGPAIFLRQHDIDDEKIPTASQRELQSRFAISCNLDVETTFTKTLGQKGRRLLFVFNEQDPHLGDYTASAKLTQGSRDV